MVMQDRRDGVGCQVAAGLHPLHLPAGQLTWDAGRIYTVQDTGEVGIIACVPQSRRS